MQIKNPPGATPLDEEIMRQLVPNLTTQGELNEFEAQNIALAELWVRSSRTLKKNFLSATGLYSLHKKMFAQTWKWAGRTRWKQTNIGVPPQEIQNALGRILGDIKFWLEHKTYSIEEIAIRFHHKLVLIHPFPNGNGRFARLATDLLLEYNGAKRFTWGAVDLANNEEQRNIYLAALRKADRDEGYDDLLMFARSS